MMADAPFLRFDAISGTGPDGRVQGVSLDLPKSGALAFLSQPGGGALTLLAIAAGTLRPNEGQIQMEGMTITAMPPTHRGMASITPDGLFPHLTVLENVALPLKVRGIAGPARRERALLLLDRTGLGASARAYPADLGPDALLRAALARALATDCPALLLGPIPPEIGEDGRAAFASLMQDSRADLGVALIHAGSDARTAGLLAERIAMLQSGRIAQLASAATLYNEPANLGIAALLGVVNLLPGSMQSLEDGIAEVKLDAGPVMPAMLADAPGTGSCILAIRQDQIAIAPLGAEEWGENAITVTISNLLRDGDYLLISARTADGTVIRLRRPAGSADIRLGPGRRAALAWQARHAQACAPDSAAGR